MTYRLLTDAIAWSRLAPDALLIQLDRNEVHLANPVAAAIVECLQAGSATLDELAAHVTEKFEVEVPQAVADIESFLREAIAFGVVDEEPPPAT